MNKLKIVLLFVPKLLIKAVLYILLGIVKLLGLIMLCISFLAGVVLYILGGLGTFGATVMLAISIWGTVSGGRFTLDENWLKIIILYVISGVIFVIPVVTGAISGGINALSTILERVVSFPMLGNSKSEKKLADAPDVEAASEHKESYFKSGCVDTDFEEQSGGYDE